MERDREWDLLMGWLKNHGVKPEDVMKAMAEYQRKAAMVARQLELFALEEQLSLPLEGAYV